MNHTTPKFSEAIKAAAALPSALFVLSSAHDGRRAGILARSVQVCADEPLLVSVTIRSGHWITSILRDSHHFALWRVEPGEALTLKKFADPVRPRMGDPFDGRPLDPLVTGAPIPASAQLALDCEVFRHIDLEADHELFVGRVLAGRCLAPAHTPAQHQAQHHPEIVQPGQAPGRESMRRV